MLIENRNRIAPKISQVVKLALKPAEAEVDEACDGGRTALQCAGAASCSARASNDSSMCHSPIKKRCSNCYRILIADDISHRALLPYLRIRTSLRDLLRRES